MLAARSGEYNWQVPASSSHVGQAIVFCVSPSRGTGHRFLWPVVHGLLKLFRPRSHNLKRFLSFLSNNLDAPAPGPPRREEYSVVDDTRQHTGTAEPNAPTNRKITKRTQSQKRTPRSHSPIHSVS